MACRVAVRGRSCIAPPALLLLGQFVGRLRRRPVPVTLVLAVIAVAVWTYLLLLVNGDIGDANIG